jgi:hypothetical protein
VNRIQKPGAYLQNLPKALDYGLDPGNDSGLLVRILDFLGKLELFFNG